jgi:hypothetical protein
MADFTKESTQDSGTSPEVPPKSARLLAIQRAVAATPPSADPVEKKKKDQKAKKTKMTTESKADSEAKVENQEKPAESEKTPDADCQVDTFEAASKAPKKGSSADPKTKPKRTRASRKASPPEEQAPAAASSSSSSAAPPVAEAAPKKRAKRSKKVEAKGEEDQPGEEKKAYVFHSSLTNLGCSSHVA